MGTQFRLFHQINWLGSSQQKVQTTTTTKQRDDPFGRKYAARKTMLLVNDPCYQLQQRQLVQDWVQRFRGMTAIVCTSKCRHYCGLVDGLDSPDLNDPHHTILTLRDVRLALRAPPVSPCCQEVFDRVRFRGDEILDIKMFWGGMTQRLADVSAQTEELCMGTVSGREPEEVKQRDKGVQTCASTLERGECAAYQMKPTSAAPKPLNTSFRASGILLYRLSRASKGSLEVLIGHSAFRSRGADLLGGKRESHELFPSQTAIREFAEETGKVLPQQTLESLHEIISNVETGQSVTNYAQAIKMVCGQYILFVVNMDRLPPEDQNAINGVPTKYDSWKRKVLQERGTLPSTAEMDDLQWMTLADLAQSSTKKRWPFMVQPKMREWVSNMLELTCTAAAQDQVKVVDNSSKQAEKVCKTRYYSMDVEAVATGYGHSDRAPAWVSVVDEDGNVLLDERIRVPHCVSALTSLTGLSTDDVRTCGSTFSEVRAKVIDILGGPDAVLVGQSICGDVDWMKLEQGRDFGRTVDLLHCFKHYFTNAARWCYYSLAQEAWALLGIEMHGENEAHNPQQDAQVSMRLFKLFHEHGEEGSPQEEARLDKLRKQLKVLRMRKLFPPRPPKRVQIDGVCLVKNHQCICGQPSDLTWQQCDNHKKAVSSPTCTAA